MLRELEAVDGTLNQGLEEAENQEPWLVAAVAAVAA
jgi:hypothetical protein